MNGKKSTKISFLAVLSSFLEIVYFVLFLFWLACVWVLRNWVFYILFDFYVLMEINLLGLVLRIYFILKWILIRWLLEVSVWKNYAFVPIYFIDIFSLIIRCLRRLDFIFHFLIWLISLLVKIMIKTVFSYMSHRLQ